MNIKQKARLKLAKLLGIKFESVQTDSIELLIDGDIEVGAEVFTKDESGELVIPADGKYVVEDKEITVVGGIITEIFPLNTEAEVETETETIELEATETEKIAKLESELSELKVNFKELAELVKELATSITGVSTDVESITEEFNKVVGKSVDKAIKQTFSKEQKSIEDTFFATKK